MKFKFSYLLITLAAIAQGIMWNNVFTVLGLTGWVSIAGGICAGAATVGMSTRAANFLPGPSLGKRARQWGWTVLICFVLAEMTVLGNSNYIVMPVKSWMTAYGAALVVTLALVAGAMVDRSLIPAEKSQSKTEAKPKSAKAKKAAVACRYAGAGCKQKFATQNAANAHARGCAYKPIAVDLKRS